MKKKSTKIVALIMVLMMLVPMCVMPASAKSVGKPSKSISSTTAYMVTSYTYLRSQPYNRGYIIRTLSYGKRVYVYSISSGWAYCSVDGKSGYINASYLRKMIQSYPYRHKREA